MTHLKRLCYCCLSASLAPWTTSWLKHIIKSHLLNASREINPQTHFSSLQSPSPSAYIYLFINFKTNNWLHQNRRQRSHNSRTQHQFHAVVMYACRQNKAKLEQYLCTIKRELFFHPCAPVTTKVASSSNSFGVKIYWDRDYFSMWSNLWNTFFMKQQNQDSLKPILGHSFIITWVLTV